MQRIRTTPIGLPALLAPAISSNETRRAAGVVDGYPPPPGSRAAGSDQRRHDRRRRGPALSPLALDTTQGHTQQRPRVVVHVATTGLSKRIDRIVEVVARKLTPSNDTFLYRRRVNPGVPILPEASALHGITDELVADSPEFAAIVPTLLEFLDNSDIEGRDTDFDLQMLEVELHLADSESGATLRSSAPRVLAPQRPTPTRVICFACRARNRGLLRGSGSLSGQETHRGDARARVTWEHAEGRRYRVAALSGRRDRHTSTEIGGRGNANEGQQKGTLSMHHRRTTPIGRWALLEPAISSTETTGAAGAADGPPPPLGSQAVAATSAGTTGGAGGPALSLPWRSTPHEVTPRRGLPLRARRSRSQRAAAAERAAVGGATVACGPASGVTRRGGGLR